MIPSLGAAPAGCRCGVPDPEWTQREPRPNAGRPPDVYYLVFDRYASNQVLQQFYGFDNGEFTARLRTLGFYVADASRCKYASTFLSLISSLNLYCPKTGSMLRSHAACRS